MRSYTSPPVVPFDGLWDDAGFATYVPPKTVHPHGFTICTMHAARCQILLSGGEFLVRQILFGFWGRRIMDVETWFSPHEFATFLDLPRFEDSTDRDLADAEGSDVSIWNKFSRRGPRVCVTIGMFPVSYFITGSVWSHGRMLLEAVS